MFVMIMVMRCPFRLIHSFDWLFYMHMRYPSFDT